jgi:CubicO group peptidase (beta-lactamase class C family)
MSRWWRGVVALTLTCTPAMAQDATRPTVESLSAFADRFFAPAMAARRIPGAVFAVVVDGQVALTRGVGVADVSTRRPVDPERTLFRLASVSKVITATAALQLVEAGRLSLHEDVNRRLISLQIPAAGPPVTLHHLLTHTAGFEERLTGLMARRAGDLEPLATYLARTLPRRFVAPGSVVSYSNHGLAVVGLLVQDVTGQPFEQYVRERVFEPIGMLRSGALVGDPPVDLATAYHLVNDQLQPLAPEYLQTGPAGAFYSTGGDMARFLLAHLRGGAANGGRILSAETAAVMHARQAGAHPALSGWCYGLWEDVRRAPRAILHDGGGRGYRALLYIVPEADLGFFVAYNLADRHDDGELQEALIREFRATFLPVAPAPALAAPAPPGEPAPSGEYRYVRRARAGVEAFVGLMNTVRIARDDSNRPLLIGRTPTPVTLHPVGASLFRRGDGRGSVAFADVRDGHPQQLVLDDGFPGVYERVPWFQTQRVQTTWLAATSLVLAYAVLRRLAARLAGKRLTRPRHADEPTSLDVAAGALNLLLVVLLPVAWLGRFEGGMPQFVFGTPLAAQALLCIPPVTAALALASVVATARRWRRRDGQPLPLRRAVVTIALCSFAAMAGYWGLMGPRR